MGVEYEWDGINPDCPNFLRVGMTMSKPFSEYSAYFERFELPISNQSHDGGGSPYTLRQSNVTLPLEDFQATSGDRGYLESGHLNMFTESRQW